MALLGNSGEEIILAAVVAGITFALLTLLKSYGLRRVAGETKPRVTMAWSR